MILCTVCGDKLTGARVRYANSPEGVRPVCPLHELGVKIIHEEKTVVEGERVIDSVSVKGKR